MTKVGYPQKMDPPIITINNIYYYWVRLFLWISRYFLQILDKVFSHCYHRHLQEILSELTYETYIPT